MKYSRGLAVNAGVVLQNRTILWVMSFFFLGISFLARGLGQSAAIWSLFCADIVMGNLVGSLELSILSRPFSFTLPGNLKVPAECLILFGILMNSTGLLFFWPIKITGASALSLLGTFMLGNFCFLAPAAMNTIFSSSMTLVSLIIPAQLLPLFIYRHWGMGTLFNAISHPLVAVPLGLSAWVFVWIRFQDRSMRRSLVGRTDFELANSWLNPAKIKKTWEKTSVEKMRETGLIERSLEQFFIRATTASGASPVFRGLAGILYSMFGRLNYRSGLTGMSVLLFLGLEYYLSDTYLKTAIFTAHLIAFFIIPITFALFFVTRLPSHFYLMPLSRNTRARTAISWSLFRTGVVMTALLVSLAIPLWKSTSGNPFNSLSSLVMPGVSPFYLILVCFAIPIYLSPFFMGAEIFLSSRSMVPLMLVPLFLLFLLFPNPSLWVSSWGAKFILIGSWGLLGAAVVWRFHSFDLGGSQSILTQAWSRRWVRMVAFAGVGLGAIFLCLRLRQPSPTLDQRLISNDGPTQQSAIQEYSGSLAVEKEKCIDGLIDVLRHDRYPDRDVTAYLLGRIGWRGLRALPVMVKALQVNHADMQWPVLTALYTWGLGARPAASAVYPLLKDPNKYIRAMAARTLVAMQVPDAGRADILRELTAAVSYINKADTERTIDSLGALGPGRPALPVLLELARTPSALVLPHVIWTLGRIGVKSPEVKAALIRGAHHPDTNVDLNALISLVWIDPWALRSDPETAVKLKQLKSHGILEGALANAAYSDDVSQGDLTDARALIELGADVNARTYGQAPLLMAVQGGHPDMVRLLLAKGADPSIRSYDQRTIYAGLPQSSFFYKGGKWLLMGYFLVEGIKAALQHSHLIPPLQTPLTFAVEADLPPDIKMEIVELLKNHPERRREEN